MHAVIFHGTMGSPEGNWFPWLKEKLESHGLDVFVPKFPTPEGQSKESWCAALRDQAPIFGKDTLLIGHSCGANHVLHVLESMETPVKYAALVGCVTDETGFEDIDALNDTFIHHDFDWAKIKKAAEHIEIFHGSDDPYVPLEQPLDVARNLGIPLTLVPDGGHLNASSNYTEFDLLYRNVKKHI